MFQPRTWASPVSSGRRPGSDGAYRRSCGDPERAWARAWAPARLTRRVSTARPVAGSTSWRVAWGTIRSGSAARSPSFNVPIASTRRSRRCISHDTWSECTRRRSSNRNLCKVTRGRVDVQCSSSFTGAIARGRDHGEDKEEETKEELREEEEIRVSLAHDRRPVHTTSKRAKRGGGGGDSEEGTWEGIWCTMTLRRER